MTSPYRKEMFDLIWPNMDAYANRHGYDTCVIHLEDGVFGYKKHEKFKKLMADGYDLICYRDDDALFTNLSIPYDSFIDEEHSFYITKDTGGFNGGSVIIKNTKEGREFNEDILNSDGGIFGNEQEYYNHQYATFDKNVVKTLNHPSINSYDYRYYKEFPERIGKEDLGDWRDGHFLLHLPAMTIQKRIEVIKQTKVIE